MRGADQRNVWRLKDNNSGKLNDRDFNGIENIEGGSGEDHFIFDQNASTEFLTNETLAPVLQQAHQLWSDAGLADGLGGGLDPG